MTSSSIDVSDLERVVRQSIWDFEPPRFRETLQVRRCTPLVRKSTITPSPFEITGELWAQPVPLELFLKTELDLETGAIQVTEMGR